MWDRLRGMRNKEGAREKGQRKRNERCLKLKGMLNNSGRGREVRMGEEAEERWSRDKQAKYERDEG